MIRTMSLLSFVACLLVGCSSTIDEERARLRNSIQDAHHLADEITTWRSGLGPGPVPASTIQTIEGYQSRAEDLIERIDDVDDEAKNSVDLIALKQALHEITEFETGNYNEASPSARASLLDQFDGLAESLRETAHRTRV